MTPTLSAALRLIIEGDPHSDLPAAIDRLAADDQRMVRYLLDAQGKRIDRERGDAAAQTQAEMAAARFATLRRGLP